jgi:hypothetical protein
MRVKKQNPIIATEKPKYRQNIGHNRAIFDESERKP